jgi:hypothetical protein
MGKWKPKKCRNCNNFVERDSFSSTGWTHVGKWEGVRCQNDICGARPKE